MSYGATATIWTTIGETHGAGSARDAQAVDFGLCQPFPRDIELLSDSARRATARGRKVKSLRVRSCKGQIFIAR